MLRAWRNRRRSRGSARYMSAIGGYKMECCGLVRASVEAYRWPGQREAVVFERSHLRHLSKGVEFEYDDVERPQMQMQEVRSVMIRW
jgi:hypothetical protein